MKSFKDLLSELTVQQRIQASIRGKRNAKKAARGRARAAKKAPSEDKVKSAVTRAISKKAFAIVDKAGEYVNAGAGKKATIELKAKKLAAKKSASWSKKLKPEIRKHMKDAFKSRMGKGSDSVHHDEN
jgi:hypothetical protein|tara:strand:+ start:422 stop:805 length:384 start_codon:yes stop_codon:yes gene_type:complete